MIKMITGFFRNVLKDIRESCKTVSIWEVVAIDLMVAIDFLSWCKK